MQPLPCLLYVLVTSLVLPLANANIVWNSTQAKPLINVVGSANYDPNNGMFQLATHTGQVGAFWWQSQVQVRDGFIATIELAVPADNSLSEKIAFVIQTSGPFSISKVTTYWGFDFTDNVALVLGANYAWYYTARPGLVNNGFSAPYRFENNPQPGGGRVQVTVSYVASGTLTVNFAGHSSSYFTPLANNINMTDGKAYVGFTGASGGIRSQYEQINVTRFEFIPTLTPGKPCDTNTCSVNATCIPSNKTYNCTCKTGFEGDGFTCTSITPCEPNPCSPNSICTSTAFDNYNCTCISGYSGINCTTLSHPISLPANLTLQSITYLRSSVLIALNWTGPSNTGFGVELSIDEEPFNPVLFFVSRSHNFTFTSDRIPRIYYFRVVMQPSAIPVYSNVLTVRPLGCMDDMCSPEIGETCAMCPNDCSCMEEVPCQDPECGGNGDCDRGKCICHPPHAGPTCSLDTQKFSTIADTKNGTVIVGIDQDTTFSIQFIAISEINTTGYVRSYSLANPANLTTSVANNESFWFLYTLGNATLNISYDTYTIGKLMTFAKQNISIPPNTLKMTIRVEHWSFVDLHNTIHLDLQVCKRDLSSTSPDCASDTLDDLYWTKEVAQNIFSVSYARNGIIDGSATQVGTIYNPTSQVTSLVIPYFFSHAILDPDFSVLVSNKTPGKGSNHMNMNLVIGVTVGSMGALVLMAVGAYVIVKRVKFARLKWRMQRDSLTHVNNSSQ